MSKQTEFKVGDRIIHTPQNDFKGLKGGKQYHGVVRKTSKDAPELVLLEELFAQCAYLVKLDGITRSNPALEDSFPSLTDELELETKQC